MQGGKMKKILNIIISIFFITLIGCGGKKTIFQDPAYDSFFEKARLIMMKEELAIYNHMPDNASKEEFIKEFWEKRDPTPDTEENENQREFEERIAYANRWFREGNSGEKGWDTERGRILLQLGFPDSREFGDYTRTNPLTGALIGTKRYPMEKWIYYTYQLNLVFVDLDGFGKQKLLIIPATLLSALDQAKFTLDLRNKDKLKRAFKFDASYKGNEISIEIPVKKLSFEEQENNMISKFRVEIYVYHDYKKIDKISEEKTVVLTKNEILENKTIDFKISYKPDQKGSYYFDIIIEEILTSSKYRNFCNTRIS
jgi:GWxTD domain-containing protein